MGLCVHEARETLAASGLRGEVVVVDNGSTDASGRWQCRAALGSSKSPNAGYGSALLSGFDASQGEVVVMGDADFTYDFGRIPELVRPVMDGRADLVVGSRFNAATRDTMPFLHRFVGTPLLTFLTRARMWPTGCDRQPIRVPRLPSRRSWNDGSHIDGHGARQRDVDQLRPRWSPHRGGPNGLPAPYRSIEAGNVVRWMAPPSAHLHAGSRLVAHRSGRGAARVGFCDARSLFPPSCRSADPFVHLAARVLLWNCIGSWHGGRARRRCAGPHLVGHTNRRRT